MKNWIIFTIIYILASAWLAIRANDNIFGPDKEATVIAAVIIYAILLILFLVYKGVRKATRKQ